MGTYDTTILVYCWSLTGIMYFESVTKLTQNSPTKIVFFTNELQCIVLPFSLKIEIF